MLILVVEDDLNSREIIQLALESMHPCKVILADTLALAESVLDSVNIDLVLTDMHLGMQSGIDLIKYARANNFKGHICLMTGDPSIHSIADALRIGADTILNKPFDLDDLSRLIRIVNNKPKELTCIDKL